MSEHPAEQFKLFRNNLLRACDSLIRRLQRAHNQRGVDVLRPEERSRSVERDLRDATLEDWFVAVGGEGRGRLVRWSGFVAAAAAKGDKDQTVIVNGVIYDYTDDGSAVRDLLLRVWTALGLNKRAERQQGEPSNPSNPSNPHALGKGSLLQLGHRQAIVYDIPDRAAWLAEKRRQYSR